jgi:adenosylcobinamide-phosphate synthase
VSAARALGLLGGWLVDQAAGDPRRGHPVARFGACAQRLEHRLYADRRADGALYTGLLVGVPTLLAAAGERRLGRAARVAYLAALTWAAVGGRSLGAVARTVGEAVRAGDLEAARVGLPALCGRDPANLGADALCRAAVESVAENTADALVAPLLWAGFAGPAGVVAHRCANTLDAMVGHRSARYRRFGWAAARLDDLLAWIPARVTAVGAAALAPAVGGCGWRAARTWWRDGARHPSPNAGRCEAAFAGALGVRLGGLNHYGGRVEQRGPLGDGPPPGPDDVERAVRLSRLVGAATAVLAAAATAAATAATTRPVIPRGVSSCARPATESRHSGGRWAPGVSSSTRPAAEGRHTPGEWGGP